MKKLHNLLFITLLLSLFGMEAYAQVPQGFNFQAVATGADGLPISDQEIGVQIEIVKGTEEGDIVYTETHTVTTNVVGLFQLTIGQGTAAEANDFTAVDWGSDNFFVGLGIDITNTSNYVSLGKTRLLSVPYALLAQDVVNGSGASAITDYEIDVSTGDTAFTVKVIGDEGNLINPAISGYANTAGFNIGVDGIGESVAGNETFQYGVRGVSYGEGTGLHYGVRGEAYAPGAWNIGVRGQAIWESTQENYGGWFSGRSSQLRNVGIIADARDNQGFGVQYNTGVVAIASGPGNGDTENGSYNSGVRAEVNGNTIGNHAISAVAFGDAGTDNAGVFAESSVNDGTTEIENTGVKAFANGPGRNVALYGASFNGLENYAGWFDGEVVINGDLTVNGSINGEGGGGGLVTQIDLDATIDTAFTVRISGDEGAVNNSAIIGEASTFGSNVGVEGKAFSQLGSDAFQVGTYGEVSGEGTGTHIAVFGSAINDGGTGGRRYGLYGQARSEGRENIGGFGIGLGSGDGEIVLRGDEFAGGEFNIGGFNIGMIGFARQNLNGNIGVRGYVYGEDGARSNRALQAEARTTAQGVNIGLQALVSGSFSENIGIEVDVYDETDALNRGVTINTGGSSASNIGLIVNAETAAELNGNTIINGDLTVSGSINGASNQTSFGIVNSSGANVVNMYAEGDNQELGGGLFLNGQSTPNIQMGGQTWDNSELGFLQLWGSTGDGNGWYQNNIFMGVGANGTDEFGSLSLNKTNTVSQTSEETINLNGESGNANFTGVVTATTVTETSDMRLKTNISSLSNALNNTLALRGVSYNWKDENKSQNIQIGVIAQEVEEIYPEFVHTDDEGMKSVNYSQMVAVLIEAVKELNAKIEVLESENTELRAQVVDIETMKSQINQLMTLISGAQSTETPHSADK